MHTRLDASAMLRNHSPVFAGEFIGRQAFTRALECDAIMRTSHAISALRTEFAHDARRRDAIIARDKKTRPMTSPALVSLASRE
jgi:hypothetical protein